MNPESLPMAVRGVVVPLVTPFTDDLRLDRVALAKHVEWLIESGAPCLLAADFVGESWALETDEKIEVVRLAVEAAAGAVPVVAKLSEPTLAGQVRLAERAMAAGASAIKLALPHQFRAQDDAVALEWLLAPARSTGLPFMVESGGDLTIQVLDRLCEGATFLGFEETTRDLVRFFDLVCRYGERVAVVAGSEDVLGFTLLAGAHGFMTATSNFAPAFMGDLLAAARAGDAQRTMRLFASLRAFRALFWEGVLRGVPLFASYAKASLALLGRPAGPPRPPLRSLTKDEVTALRGVLPQAFGFLTTDVSV